MQTTAQLDYPVHFVCPPYGLWPELAAARFEALPAEVLALRSKGGLECWVTRTCYEFRRSGLDVTISPEPKPDCINIASVRDLGRRTRTFDAFMLIPRLDAHEPRLANFVLHQNNVFEGRRNAAWVHHWPQPGIRPRAPLRGNMVRRLTYKGRARHLADAFRAPGFLAELARLQISFDQTDGTDQSGEADWSDYSGDDVVLAVRNLTRYAADIKPASKLVNAWYAEVPALLGPEPAYRALRETELDYLEVQTPHEALAALRRLQAEPGLYAAMVENGRRRRTEITAQSVLAQWIGHINGPVGASFAAWQRRSPLTKRLEVLVMMLREPQSKRRHRRQFRTGPRLFDTA